MSTYTKVILVGNLTRDPDLRDLASGDQVCSIRIATSESYKNKQGEVVDKPCYVDVDVWGKSAAACGTHLSKGRKVLVDGRLQLDQWETEKGEKRSRLKVKAEKIQFMGGKPATTASNSTGNSNR